MEKYYLKELCELKELADSIKNTKMMSIAKINAMIMLNMRYEPISIDSELDVHPYKLVNNLVIDAKNYLSQMKEILFIEDSLPQNLTTCHTNQEEMHKKLFQKLWIDFTIEDYNKRIERYSYRLQINDLSDGFMKGFQCIDFGCGHGNFAHAMLKNGASYIYGIDFGVDSIEYAINARDRLNVSSSSIMFKVESVYNVSKENETFDFAVQNGVFHHLDDEDSAYKEVWRVLKMKGLFWVYTDGAGSIKNDLWETSKYILKDIPDDFIISYLKYLNIETGKRYHLGDGMNAIYRYTTWDDITSRLSDIGFGNFRRLIGGYPTDYDHDVIAKHKYGKEKFGEGNIRLLAQKIRS